MRVRRNGAEAERRERCASEAGAGRCWHFSWVGGAQEVVDALTLTMRQEGLIPALESSHAFVQAYKEAPTMSPDEVIIINQSGRGDKDIFTIADAFGDPEWENFIQKKAKEYHARRLHSRTP